MNSAIDKSIYFRFLKFLHRKLESLSIRIEKALREINFLIYKHEFGERDDDIYIISYPRSGTTLTQMLVYQLTTDGNIDFDNLDDVSPWLRNQANNKSELKNLPSPRIIKSHDAYERFDHSVKGKFIYVFRNPEDVALSRYHQDLDYNNTELNIDEYMIQFFRPGRYNWFLFHKQWLVNKKKSNILYIKYEDLIDNMDSCIERIVEFCNLDLQNIDIERVKQRSSFAFMKLHSSKFGLRQDKSKDYNYNGFIREGKKGEGLKKIPEKYVKLIELNYNKIIRPIEANFN